MTKQYEDWQLIHWLKDFAEEIEKTPTQLELEHEPTMPNANVYNQHFGSYNNAVKKAGLEVNRRRYSKKELLKKLKNFCDELGRAPTEFEVNQEKDMPSHFTYARRFNGFRKAIEKVGYKLRAVGQRPGTYNKRKVIQEIIEFKKKHGWFPEKQKHYNNFDILPSHSTVHKFLGNLKKAKKIAKKEMKKT